MEGRERKEIEIKKRGKGRKTRGNMGNREEGEHLIRVFISAPV